MVKREEILLNIRQMRKNGVDEETIKSTLKETGLEEKEIEEYLSEEKNANIEPNQGLEENHEQIANRTADKVKEHINDSMQTQDLFNTSTHVELKEQKERIEGVHKSLDSLHTKTDLTPSFPMQTISQINVIEKRMRGFEKELAEIRANTNALSSLLKKIIETNREILTELKKK